MSKYDVAIVGGGLVGSTLAYILGSYGLSCILYDNSNLVLDCDPAQDNRGIGLSDTSIKILTEFNLWQQIKPYSHVINKVHVSKANTFGSLILEERQPLGALVSINAILKTVNTAIVNLPNISYKHEQADNLNLDSKLIVAADGINSSFRKKLNIGVSQHDYEQSAIVTNIEFAAEHKGIAYERFLSKGSIALLPFGKNKMKCILIAEPNRAMYWLNCKEQDFLSIVNQEFKTRLGEAKSVDKRIIFPLKEVKAKKIYKNNIVLLGNAVNAINPIAAQGYNLALRDIATLARLIKSGNLDEPDKLLHKYAKLRAADHHATTKATHTLSMLYEHNSKVIGRLRDFSQVATGLINPLKQKIISMGQGREYYE